MYSIRGLSCLCPNGLSDEDVEYITSECCTLDECVSALGRGVSAQEAMERAVSRSLISLRWLTDVTYCDSVKEPGCSCGYQMHSIKCALLANGGWRLHPAWTRTNSFGWLPIFFQLCESARDFEAGEQIIRSLYPATNVTYRFLGQRERGNMDGRYIEHMYHNELDHSYFGIHKQETPQQKMLRSLSIAAKHGVYLENVEGPHMLLQAATPNPELRRILGYAEIDRASEDDL